MRRQAKATAVMSAAKNIPQECWDLTGVCVFGTVSGNFPLCSSPSLLPGSSQQGMKASPHVDV